MRAAPAPERTNPASQMAEGEEGAPVYVVLVSGPDQATLADLGRRLVEERLAACANVWGGIRSVYRWQGEVEEAGEALALLKTTGGSLDALQQRVRALHPYEEPEILALAVDAGSSSYLTWVAESVADG